MQGTSVHYRTWGVRGRPGLVLVHGAAAHAGWWAHIAPFLTGHRVIALDLSGHGDSGHRTSYDMEVWAQEVLAVAAAEGLRRPVIVGHSMGGRTAVTAGVRAATAVGGVVCVDTPLTRSLRSHAAGRGAANGRAVYPTPEDAVAHFRTRPEASPPAYLRAAIARDSVREVQDGWTWKADEGLFGRGRPMQDLLPSLSCPIALLHGDHGLLSPDMATEWAALCARPVPLVELPAAGHHPMLDAPLPLVAALRALLATWPPAA